MCISGFGCSGGGVMKVPVGIFKNSSNSFKCEGYMMGSCIHFNSVFYGVGRGVGRGKVGEFFCIWVVYVAVMVQSGVCCAGGFSVCSVIK